MKLSKQLVFVKNLHKAVKSGLTLDSFFDRLAKNTFWPSERMLYASLSKAISEGSTLSAAFAGQKRILDEVYVKLIEVGEKSGKLDEILKNIIEMLQSRISIRKKIFSELRMPVINIGGALLVFGILFFLLIPALASFFSGFSCCPPLIVNMMILAQETFFNIKFFYFLVFVAVLFPLIQFYTSEIDNPIEFIDYKLIKLPIFGSIFRWHDLYVYFLVLKSCYSAGLSLIESTQLAADAVNNRYLKTVAGEIRERSAQGEPINAILSDYIETKIFEPEISQMIEVGESTGRVDEAYNDVNELLRDNIESRIETICRITPLIGLVLAALPIVIILLIILGILAKSASIIMNGLNQAGLL